MGDAGKFESTFSVPRMDCPSEENMIRMALQDVKGVQALTFDLAHRKLTVVHRASAQEMLERLEPLGLGAALAASRSVSSDDIQQGIPADEAAEARVLWLLLSINATMFVVEIVVGFIAQSTGLMADALDMFADAAVYGLSLFAVGRAAAMKIRAAHVAGWLQIILAVLVLGEAARRFIYGSEPVSSLMMGMGLLALGANVVCLILVARKRHAGAHMKASYIFSANDVIANAGVIVAGFLVAVTGSNYPDLVIGAIVGLLVLNGARRILRLQ
jgi:Co/Zn/Cd efflux system component